MLIFRDGKAIDADGPPPQRFDQPRHPAGSPMGGQFAPAGGGSATVGTLNGMSRVSGSDLASAFGKARPGDAVEYQHASIGDKPSRLVKGKVKQVVGNTMTVQTGDTLGSPTGALIPGTSSPRMTSPGQRILQTQDAISYLKIGD